MSSSLVVSLEKMHIPSEPLEYKDPNLQTELQVPNWDTPRRVLYYGFNITEEWLLNYSAAHWNEYTPHLDIKVYPKMTRGTSDKPGELEGNAFQVRVTARLRMAVRWKVLSPV